MPTSVMAFISFIVRRITNSIAKNLWQEVWAKIFEYVVKAEEYWEEKNRGQQKKEWVIRKVKSFILEKRGLNWIKIKIIEVFLSLILDAIISTLNEEIGNDWVDVVEELEEDFKDKIFNSA